MTKEPAISFALIWHEKRQCYRFRILRYWGGYIYERDYYLPKDLNVLIDNPRRLPQLFLITAGIFISLMIAMAIAGLTMEFLTRIFG